MDGEGYALGYPFSGAYTQIRVVLGIEEEFKRRLRSMRFRH